MLKHLSLFSGVGGFDLGLEMAGVQTIAQCENDKYAQKVLRHHWPEVELHEDICELDGEQYRGIDIISGGFPCQGLSVAGRRKGLADARSGLFFQMCRVVAAARPRLLLWENVPGLLSQDGRRAIVEVERALADCGYYGAWRVINSQFAGVPQRRRRVFGAFAAGSAGGWACGAAVLLEPEGGGWSPAEGGEAGEGVAGGALCGTLESRLRVSADSAAAGHFIPDVVFTCTARDAKGVSQREEDTAYTLRQDPGGVGNAHNTNFVAFTQNQRNELRLCGGDGEQVGALPAERGAKQQAYLAGAGVRRLTPTECERLQGFPDSWTNVDGMSDTQRYRQLGNAVSVPVAYWIGIRARMALEAST